MRYILIILFLFFGCDNSTEPIDIYGCTVETACNFNPEANVDDSCEYPEH